MQIKNEWTNEWKNISENEFWAVSAILGLSPILTDVDSYNSIGCLVSYLR